MIPTGPIDHLGDDAFTDYLARWCAATSESELERDDLDTYYNTISLRSLFLKSCPESAAVLDMGAGNGTLSVYKTWPDIPRPDLKLYGVSLEPIEMADAYERVSIANFETNPRPFGDVRFDAVLAAHFIEHLADPGAFIKWIVSCLKPGGRMYLEWPHPLSRRMPSNAFFVDRKIPVFTSHFMDDATHIEPWAMQTIVDATSAEGMTVESAGRIVLPHMAGQLRDSARRNQNIAHGTFAVWAAVGWAQYLILSKPL